MKNTTYIYNWYMLSGGGYALSIRQTFDGIDYNSYADKVLNQHNVVWC